MADCNNGFKEAVCVDAGRVYDSCCDRDCLEDLRVYFSVADQQLINEASNVRARNAELLTVLVDVDPVTFNRGYYSVDMTFFFAVEVEVFSTALPTTRTTINGFSVFNKKVILCGTDGSAKTFSSDDVLTDESDLIGRGNMPKATVQTIDPIILATNLCPICGCDCDCGYNNIPMAVARATVGEEYLNQTVLELCQSATKKVTVTLGLFSVVQLIRNVQMLMPVYDFCVPEKECIATTDNPCELFKKIKFPVDEFFPTGECEQSCCESCDSCES